VGEVVVLAEALRLDKMVVLVGVLLMILILLEQETLLLRLHRKAVVAVQGLILLQVMGLAVVVVRGQLDRPEQVVVEEMEAQEVLGLVLRMVMARVGIQRPQQETIFPVVVAVVAITQLLLRLAEQEAEELGQEAEHLPQQGEQLIREAEAVVQRAPLTPQAAPAAPVS